MCYTVLRILTRFGKFLDVSGTFAAESGSAAGFCLLTPWQLASVGFRMERGDLSSVSVVSISGAVPRGLQLPCVRNSKHHQLCRLTHTSHEPSAPSSSHLRAKGAVRSCWPLGIGITVDTKRAWSVHQAIAFTLNSHHALRRRQRAALPQLGSRLRKTTAIIRAACPRR